MKMLIELFIAFVKVGATMFGGGYAMLPILQREIVGKRHWASDEELMDYYAIGQCTPGAIAVNTATFVGYKCAGIMGGIFSTIGVVFPSIVIITLIAAFLTNFAELPAVVHALNGVRAAVCVLILDSVIKLGKKSVKDSICLIIFLLILAASLFLKASPIWIVVAAGAAGCFLKPLSEKIYRKREE
ncbi:MAG: chromate transporter [Lachnospiraceae bacterium]|nr:chromate transporter [Lachnospiraceae bacterium]